MLILGLVNEHVSLCIEVFKVDQVNARIIENFAELIIVVDNCRLGKSITQSKASPKTKKKTIIALKIKLYLN